MLAGNTRKKAELIRRADELDKKRSCSHSAAWKLIFKITIKRDLLFFYGKKSNGIKEPIKTQLGCYLAIVMLSISI